MSATDLEAAKQPYPQRRLIVNAILYPPIQKTSRVEIEIQLSQSSLGLRYAGLEKTFCGATGTHELETTNTQPG